MNAFLIIAGVIFLLLLAGFLFSLKIAIDEDFDSHVPEDDDE